MLMKKVLFIDTVHPLIREELTNMGFQCDSFPQFGYTDLKAIVPEYYGIIIRSKIKLDKEFLGEAAQLKFIGRLGSGLENIDVPFAESRGISCLNSPEGNRDAVGEHTLGMLLSLMNNICLANREVRQGKWIREGNRGIEIKAKTIGIIGYGNMGSAFAQRLKGFEADVIAYDKYKSAYGDGFVVESSMEELWERADILSLHVPLTEETRYLAAEAFFGKFAKEIFFLNSSRGQVVDTSALVAALKTGKVKGAALDVLEFEDNSFEALSKDIPEDLRYLLKAKNVVLTPHIAGWTVESSVKLARVLVEKIRRIGITG
ncbi:MAG: NAD(P)-binding domain-containing protein [Bacteroidetes bacterium]|nr:NAD(P)-binding domain-containing protein [Bacteroidota bacterium]